MNDATTEIREEIEMQRAKGRKDDPASFPLNIAVVLILSERMALASIVKEVVRLRQALTDCLCEDFDARYNKGRLAQIHNIATTALSEGGHDEDGND